MSTTQDETPRRGRGRPRTPGAEKRIIDAALEEYGEHGWSGFTMDGVARRAGVGKSTVYLRWQDRDSLLTDAVSGTTDPLGTVDTGSLHGDLRQLAINVFESFLRPDGWASLRILIDTAGAPARLGRFSEAVAQVQIGNVGLVLERAVGREEVPSGVSSDLIAHSIWGSVILQTLTLRLEGRNLSEEAIAERADALASLLLGGMRR
ncbi:TetR/AcrR family transcriptional regulator [Nocardioides pyridinolyticus]